MTCVSRVEKALKKVPGVIDATVNLATEKAHITGAGVSADVLMAAIEKAGHEASSPTPLVDVTPGHMPWQRLGEATPVAAIPLYDAVIEVWFATGEEAGCSPPSTLLALSPGQLPLLASR